jgi:hypothetical protein
MTHLPHQPAWGCEGGAIFAAAALAVGFLCL